MRRLTILIALASLALALSTLVACQGPPGEQGLPGPQGERGEVGPAPSEEALLRLIEQVVNAHKEDLRGPSGPQGDRGLTGLTGLTGPQGAVGPQGLTGPAAQVYSPQIWVVPYNTTESPRVSVAFPPYFYPGQRILIYFAGFPLNLAEIEFYIEGFYESPYFTTKKLVASTRGTRGHIGFDYWDSKENRIVANPVRVPIDVLDAVPYVPGQSRSSQVWVTAEKGDVQAYYPINVIER